MNTPTPRRLTPTILALAILGALVLAGCASSADKPEAFVVKMTTAKKFDPHLVTIGKGDTVKWTNADTVAHTVTSDNATGPLHSGPIQPGKDFSFTFDALGDFAYHSDEDATMAGTITVEA
jgi:plastocyanin